MAWPMGTITTRRHKSIGYRISKYTHGFGSTATWDRPVWRIVETSGRNTARPDTGRRIAGPGRAVGARKEFSGDGECAAKKSEGTREEATLSLRRHRCEYEAIRSLSKERRWPVWLLCRILHIARSAYYQRLRQPQSKCELENECIARQVEQIHRIHPGMGYRRIRDDRFRHTPVVMGLASPEAPFPCRKRRSGRCASPAPNSRAAVLCPSAARTRRARRDRQ